MAKKEQGDKDTPVGALWLWSCNKISLVAMSLCVVFLWLVCSFSRWVSFCQLHSSLFWPDSPCLLHKCSCLPPKERNLQFTMAQQEERKLISVVANCKCNLLKSFPDGRH